MMRINALTRAPRLAALAVGALVLLGGCGSDGPASEDAGNLSYTEADIEFLQQMKPHHEQAIEMAEMVGGRTDRPELNTLASDIIESQSAEIEEIDSMLEEAGETSSQDPAVDHGDVSMGMTQEDMDALESSEGDGFDEMFAEMMIEHHRSAIEMANKVLADGENAKVASLARGIIEEQQKEIQDLEAWLEEWGL